MGDARDVLADLWRDAGGLPACLQQVTLSGCDPVLPSSFRVGTAAQVSIAAAGLAAAQIHRSRGGQAQAVRVDMRHAAVEFESERHFRVDNNAPPSLWDAIAGTYRCGDGRWVRIHTNFTHHRDGILAILECDNDRESVAAALGRWSAEDFEKVASERGTIASMLRSESEWDQHPQGSAVASEPLFGIDRIGDAPPEPRPWGARPLEGVRVLDLTRIIAGPVAGRTLAAHGADVLLVTAAHLPSVEPLVIDSGRGKRACHVDLRNAGGQDTLRDLRAHVPPSPTDTCQPDLGSLKAGLSDHIWP